MNFTNLRQWWKQSSKTPQVRHAKRGRYRPLLEALEDRTLFSVSLVGVPQWIDQGPVSIHNNNTPANPLGDAGLHSLPYNSDGASLAVAVGAIQSIAVQPVQAADNTTHYVVYAGTVNGGIWRAGFIDPNTGQWVGNITPAMFSIINIPLLQPFPLADPTQIVWRPMSDSQPSLATSSLALDPNDLSGNTLWAGTGSLSSANAGGPAIGLLKTTDGGQTWTVLGTNGTQSLQKQHILSIVPTVATNASTQVVLVASQEKGIFRSSDGGQTFQNVQVRLRDSTLAFGQASDLIADPVNNNRFYAAMINLGRPNQSSGVFQSDDRGTSWYEIDSTYSQMAQATGIKLATQFNGQTILFAVTEGVVYLPPNNNNYLTGAFFGSVPSGRGPTQWTQIGTPPGPPLMNDLRHFSAVADPNQIGTFYVAGFQGNIYRIRLSDGWTKLHASPAVNDSSGHGDYRHVAFLGSSLLAANDGGIYGLAHPSQSDNTSYWVSLNSNLRNTEMYNAQFDPRNGQIFGGAQDIGTPVGIPTIGTRFWTFEPTGNSDGGPTAMGLDHQYYSRANFGNYYFDGKKLQDPPDDSGWYPNGSNFGSLGQRPIGASPVLPGQLMLSTNGGTSTTPQPQLYEIFIFAEAFGIAPLKVTPRGMSGNLSAIAYGGVDNPNAAYFGTNTGQIFYRSTPGATFTRRTAWSGSTPIEIAVDPYDSKTAYVLDTNGFIWQTSNAGASWNQSLTGDLGTISNSTIPFSLDTLTLCDPNPTQAGQGVLVVGGFGGVYSHRIGASDPSWRSFGRGLPNVQVTDVHYIPPNGDASKGDLLLVSTFGRGAWTIPAASSALAVPAQLIISGDGRGDNLTLRATSSGVQIDLNGQISFYPYGPRTLSSIAINLGGGTNIINVKGTAANMPVIITGGGTDTVNIGEAGRLLGIDGPVDISNPSFVTTLNVNDFNDDAFFRAVTLDRLQSTGANRVLVSGFAPITYRPGQVNALNVYTGWEGADINVESTPAGSATTINTRAGANQINVQSTGLNSTTTINADLGTSQVFVTPAGHSLDLLGGTLAVNGNGATTVHVDDRYSAAQANIYTFTNGQLQLARHRTGPPTYTQITYNNLASLTLLDSFGTQFNVVGVLSTGGTKQMVLDTTGTAAQVSVGNAVTNLDGIGNLVVEGGAYTTLILDDRANKLRSSQFSYYVPLATSYVITDQNVARTSFTNVISLQTGLGVISPSDQTSITYRNIASLSLYGGSSREETINVLGTSANIPVTVYAGPGMTGGTNTVNVGSNALTPAASVLDLVGGPLSVIGQGSTALNFNDQGRTAAQGYAFLPDGNDAGNFYRGLGRPIYFSNVAGVTLHGGSGGNTINVFGTPANIPITVYAGAGLTGSNTVNVGSNFLNPSLSILDLVGGPLNVIGQGSTALNLNDQGRTAAQGYAFLPDGNNAGDFYRGFGRPIHFSNVASVALHGGSGGNSINVFGTPANIPITVYSGGGIDQVNVLSTRGQLDINNPGGEDTVTVGNTRARLTVGGDSLGNVQGDVYVSGQGRTFLYVDDSEDSVARNATISYDGTYGTLAGSAALGLIRWVPSTLSFTSGVIDVDVYAGTGANTFTVKGSGTMQQLYLRTRGDRGVAGQVNLLATNSPTYAVGFDTVIVGSMAPALGGTLANIKTPVYILGAAHQTSLIVDDSGDTTGRTATVTDSWLNGLAPASIQFSYYNGFPLKSLTIYGGRGNDTFNIQSTAAGTTTLVDSGRGSDVLQVGNNRVLSGINGALHLRSATSFSGVDLFLDDSNDLTPKTQVVLNDGSVTGLAPATISWTSSATGDGGITGVYVFGGRGGNIFTVKNTSLLYHYTFLIPGTGSNQVYVQGMQGVLLVHGVFGGVDAVTVGSQAPSLGGTLANVKGDIYVQGGSSASLIVDDTGTTTDRIATMTATGVTWQTPAAIHWVPGVVHAVTLNWGSGDDYFFVNSTAAGVTTVINGGEGNDGFGLWSLDEIRGPVALHGQGGLYDYPLLYDYFNPAGNTYTLTTDRVQRLGKADITFDSMIQLILYTSGTGVDTVYVESVAQDVFTPIVLGNGDKITLGRPLLEGGRTLQDIRGTVRPQTYGNGNGAVAVVVDNSGDTDPRQATFTYVPANVPLGNGHILSGLAPAPIYFQLDATASLLVKGGLGNDSFKLPNVVPPVPLTLDGGGGTNTLDYSAFTTGAIVNLLTGTATAAAGGVVNFANVLGGAGDDVLIGNAAANDLRGGAGNDILVGGAGNDMLFGDTGRDILIGGLGADLLQGGIGDDILIGGYTDYDTQFSNGVARYNIDFAALNAVMAEWASSDSYNVRFGAIKAGVGPIGQYRLDPTTVHDDAASDTLTGGDGQDWFFVPKIGDTITDLDFNPSDLTNKREKITNIK